MLTLLALLAHAAPSIGATPVDTTLPAVHRVYDTRSRMFVDDDMMLRELSRADVVMFGEQHDDPVTHQVERDLLAAIDRPGAQKVLAMEMFERDVQSLLDDYLAGRISEDSLLAGSRPWPRYATDYRPMVELARAEHWPVIAGNVPRSIASAVAKGGLSALDTLNATQRSWVARDLVCAHDDYFARFEETMKPHLPGETDAEKAAALERYYQSQCVKDETMAESVMRTHFRVVDDLLLFHVNGAFHSDYALGTAARIARRWPRVRMMVLTALPVADPFAVEVDPADLGRADFLIYTLAPPAK